MMTLSPEIEKLIEARLKQGGFASADDLVRAAIETLDRCDPGPLDGETLAAIDRAEEQIRKGEYQDWQQAVAALRSKYLSQ